MPNTLKTLAVAAVFASALCLITALLPREAAAGTRPRHRTDIARTGVVAPLPLGMRLFSRRSVWNAPVSRKARPAPSSRALVTALSAEVEREIYARKGPWINTSVWSTPVYTVGSGVPRSRVQLDIDLPQLQRDFDSVPIPPDARPAGGGDRHLVVYQPATDTLWEFWLAQRQADGWHARYGGRMAGVSTSPGYFASRFGATATSLPLLGGLITINELRRGRIDHALALGIPNTTANAFTWPAQRGDGRTTGPGTLPEGTHLRIDPSVDLSKLGLSPSGLAIARAAQRYGIVIRDTSGAVTFYAEDPVAAGGDPYWPIWHGAYPNNLLRGFPWQSLQVVAPPSGG